jgi:hypothetical protein
MSKNTVKGELHGCVVCGRLHELYVVYDPEGKFVDMKVMSPDGRRVESIRRPLVACQRHSQAELDAALARTYGVGDDED